MAKILVVDDEKSLCKLTCKLLERAGHQTVGFERPKDALNQIFDGGIDLVLTDLIMPEMNGAALVESIRKIEPDMPIIVMSGGGQRADSLLNSLGDIGFVGTISKPFMANDLLSLIDSCLTGSRSAELHSTRAKNV